MIQKIIFAGIMAAVAALGFSTVYPFDPALSETNKFEHHYQLSARFPFLSSYLLLSPADYNPEHDYPLIVALHGGYKRSLAAYVAAQDTFQQRTPAFVLMPMAQFRQRWARSTGSGGS